MIPDNLARHQVRRAQEAQGAGRLAVAAPPCRRRRNARGVLSARIRGFTLVELAVVLAILAVIALTGFPGFVSLRNQMLLSSAARDTVTMVRFAKMEALRRNESVVICGSDDGTECAESEHWSSVLAFARRSNVPLQVVDVQKSVRLTQVAAPGSTVPEPIRFAPDGSLRNSTGAPVSVELSACLGGASAAHDSRKITINAGGRIKSFRVNTGLPCPLATSDA